MENKEKQKRRPKVEPGMSRKNGEGVVIKNSIGNFQPKGSKGEKIIEEIIKCPIKSISKKSLINLTKTLCLFIYKKDLPRKYKRNIILTIKWVNDNSDLIEQFFSHVYMRPDFDKDPYQSFSLKNCY